MSCFGSVLCCMLMTDSCPCCMVWVKLAKTVNHLIFIRRQNQCSSYRDDTSTFTDESFPLVTILEWSFNTAQLKGKRRTAKSSRYFDLQCIYLLIFRQSPEIGIDTKRNNMEKLKQWWGKVLWECSNIQRPSRGVDWARSDLLSIIIMSTMYAWCQNMKRH